jgi:N-methylhydantoinase A/oxoprolinase/acetone carboxylase beta subunit
MDLLHPMQLDGQKLVKEEILGRSALTPTDLFHLTGEFSPWDQSAAQTAAGILGKLIDLPVETMIRSVRTIMAEKIVEEVVKFITNQALERYPAYVPLQNLGAWLFEENIDQSHPYLGSQIRLKMPIIGIGAPAGLLLPRVADLLHTELILPQHYEVANAIGAVVGSVIVTKEAWIYPKLRNMYPVGFIVQTNEERKVFPTSDQAITYAENLLLEQADASIHQAGARVGETEVVRLPEGAESYRIRVTAIGNPLI